MQSRIKALWDGCCYLVHLCPHTRRVVMMSVALSKRKCSYEHLFYTNKAVETSTLLQTVL